MAHMPKPFRPAVQATRVERRRFYDQQRDAGQAFRKWYKTARWQRLRAAHLADSPLCVKCEALGVIVTATVCDHIEPHRGCDVKFWVGPFQSLCASCHAREKQREEQQS